MPKIKDRTLRLAYDQATNTLAKWRKVFTSWQLGTRTANDGEALAVADHRELTILLRAELNTMLAVLIEKEVVTETEWVTKLIAEMKQMERDFESRFPGVRATPEGLEISVSDYNATCKRMHFPP